MLRWLGQKNNKKKTIERPLKARFIQNLQIPPIYRILKWLKTGPAHGRRDDHLKSNSKMGVNLKLESCLGETFDEE